jgi:membrane protease YdiL (CAAX protease family)
MLSEKPWKLDVVVRLLLRMAICFCSIWFVMGLVQHFRGGGKLDENLPLYLMARTLSMQGSILLVIAITLHQERIGWAEAFGFKRAGLGYALVLGLLVATVLLLVGNSLKEISVKLLWRFFRHEAPIQEAVQTLQNAVGWNTVYMVVFTVLVAPPAEEMLFRGILYPAVKQFGYPRLALWGTSLMFAAIHFSAPIFLPLTVLALALTFLYEKTDNLLACICAHSTFNAANVLIWYLTENMHRPPG